MIERPLPMLPIQNYLSLLGNDPFTELLNQSQLHYLRQFVPENERCLSAVSPVLSWHSDSLSQLSLETMTAQLMAVIYPSTLVALQMSGQDLRVWLEMSASIYQKPNDSSMMLLRKDALTFLFYPIAGIDYQINIDEAPLFDQFGNPQDDLTAGRKGRIEKMCYRGKVVQDDDQFTLITSHFAPFLKKAYWQGNRFISLNHQSNREVLAQYCVDLMKSISSKPSRYFSAQIAWHWRLVSRISRGLFLPIPLKILTLPEQLEQSYRMIMQEMEPSGYEIYFQTDDQYSEIG